MTVFEMLAQAAKSPARTIREVWFDFERWERARGFVDDPSRPAKAALDWVRDLYELDAALADTAPQATAAELQACHDALEATFVAFAQLTHQPEIEAAMLRWREARASEIAPEAAVLGNRLQ